MPAAVAEKLKLKPLGSRVVIKALEREEMTKSGIVLPDTANERPQEGTVLAVGPGAKDENGKRIPVHGETWVSLVEFSTPIKAKGLMSYGNASQPGSPHRSDQLQHLSDKTFRTLWTTRAEVEQHLEGRVAI